MFKRAHISQSPCSPNYSSSLSLLSNCKMINAIDHWWPRAQQLLKLEETPVESCMGKCRNQSVPPGTSLPTSVSRWGWLLTQPVVVCVYREAIMTDCLGSYGYLWCISWISHWTLVMSAPKTAGAWLEATFLFIFLFFSVFSKLFLSQFTFSL